jgi:hypothetical protein
MPVEYQGKQPACGAHSGGALQGIRKQSRFSPRFQWAGIKTFDGSPIEAGTDIRSIFKSLTKANGSLDFDSMGNEVSLSLEDYAHPAISQAQVDLASKSKGDGYGFAHEMSFNGIKQFISDHGPCILLIQVGPEFWTAPNGQISWQEKDILPLRPPSKIISGHFVVAHSFDEDYVYFLNSFSDAWGRKGHGYFGLNYIQWVRDAGTLFPLAFTKDLSFGMTDPDVLRLQKVLNQQFITRVAALGPGSPGQETEYFGPKTKAAVQRFQTLHDLPSTGFVGPLTRAQLQIYGA